MNKIENLPSEEQKLINGVWETFHASGIPATGLAQAMLAAARHHSLNKTGDLRQRTVAQTEMMRLNNLADLLYGESLAELTKTTFGSGADPEAVAPLARIKNMGKADALNGQLRFEGATKEEAIRLAASFAYLEKSGGFEKSRWAVMERHYWEGVGRVLATQYVERAGLKESIDKAIKEKQAETSPEEVAFRQRAKAVKALGGARAGIGPKEMCALIYESFEAENQAERAADQTMPAAAPVQSRKSGGV